MTVSVGGIWPYIIRSASGGIGGTDPMILNLLAEKFNFSLSLFPVNTHRQYFATVRTIKILITCIPQKFFYSS